MKMRRRCSEKWLLPITSATFASILAATLVSCVGDASSGDAITGDASTDRSLIDSANDGSPPDSANDGATLDGGSPDTGSKARCDPTMAFDNPSPVSELNTSGLDARMRLTGDGLTAYWQSDRLSGDAGPYPGQVLFSAQRSTSTGVFGSIAPVFPSNMTSANFGGAVSGDNLVLLFGVSEVPGGFDIFSSSRTTVTVAFANIAAVTTLNSNNSDVNLYLLPDQAAVYFSSDRATANTNHLYRSVDVNGTFSTPVELTEFISAGGEDNATVTPDELTLYFSKANHIYEAHRTLKTASFGPPSEVTALSSAGGEFPSWISPDNCEIYFTSARPGTGGLDLYRALRKGATK